MSIIQFIFCLKSTQSHQKILTLWLGVIWILGFELIGNASESPEDSVVSKRYQFESKHMGTLFRIIIYATDADAKSVQNASRDAFQRIEELNGIFSDYLHESELNKLSRRSGTGDFKSVSEPLWRILKYSVKVSELSGGAFDVTVGPSVRLWRRAMRRAEYPDSKRLQSASEAVGFSKIIFHPSLRSVQLLDSSMRLDLGGIAKGYAVDEASAVLKRHGFNHCLVEG
ncbi:MAG TPA: hypothetical protein EYG38_06035, partial [Verrucomicrobia bacterium]|nr:hypothetical protein [Verrucomicrobiota bacterium]